MKKKLVSGLISITALTCTASYAGTMGDIQTFAPRGGWVVGGDIGYGYLSTQEEDLLPPVPVTIPPVGEALSQNHRIGSLVGGGYLGRDFTFSERILLGLEVGYKYLGKSKYQAFTIDARNNFISSNIEVNQQAVDFLLTGKVYIWQRLNLIGKVGAAYVCSETKQNSSFNVARFTGGLITDATIWRIKPELGVGVGYTWDTNIGLNIMYTHIGGADTNVTGLYRFFNSGPDRTPAVYQYNALTAGISYTFG